MNHCRAIAALSALLSLTLTLHAADSPQTAPLLPKNGIYFGAWVLPEGPKGGGAKDSGSFGEPETEQMEQQIGRKLALHVHYCGWSSGFPMEAMKKDAAMGRIPVISWADGSPLAATIAGADDAMLTARAQEMKAYGKPVFLRYMWEMNLVSLPDKKKAYGDVSDAEDGRLYVAGWQHIWKIFHDQGVTNVIWLWNPSAAAGLAEGRRVDSAGFYPGDAYVDWIGMDAYERKGEGYIGVFSFFYKEFEAHKKPYMIVETGAFPENQVRYLHEVQTLSQSKFPMIQGFLYFDAPGHTVKPWSLTPDGVKAFAEVGKDPYFQGKP